MRHGRTLLAVLLLASQQLLPRAAGQDWPRFRGPNGDGRAEAVDLPVEFGPERNQAFVVEVPEGRSSPVLAGSHLYLSGVDGDLLVTLCLDAASGGLVWKRSVEKRRHDDMYAGNNSASPTPATDGDHVVVFFPEYGLLCYGVDGAPRWEVPLGPYRNFYGVASSPVLAGDVALLLVDERSGGFLLAVDLATGEERWRASRAGMVESWTTPVLGEDTSGRTLVLTFGHGRVHAYDLADGAEVWTWNRVGPGPIASPVVAGEYLLVCAPNQLEQGFPGFDAVLANDRDGDGQLVAAELEGSDLAGHFGWTDADGDGVLTRAEWEQLVLLTRNRHHGLVALRRNVADGEEREAWRHKRSLAYMPTPVVAEGVVFMVCDGGILTSLDLETGAVIKSDRLPVGGEYAGSPIAADDKLYLPTSAGELVVTTADGDWEVLAVNELGEDLAASPAARDGSLYVRTLTHLHCFEQLDG